MSEKISRRMLGLGMFLLPAAVLATSAFGADAVTGGTTEAGAMVKEEKKKRKRKKKRKAKEKKATDGTGGATDGAGTAAPSN